MQQYIFQDTDQLFKDFRLGKRHHQFSIKNKLCKFIDKNNSWDNHRFKLDHDENTL